MSWKKVNVVFKLKTPLHIGYLPFKGSVISPTRYYVPGRNFWGATVKRVTEHLYESPKAEHYKEIGKKIKEYFKFSYFYLFDGNTIYFPRFTDEGMKYGDEKSKITKHEFEFKFIGSRVSTAIDGSYGSAKIGSLHEIEFINNKFKDKEGKIKDTKIIGCIWVKEKACIETERGQKKVEVKDHEGIFIDDFNIIETLTIGGESKYGFGHIQLDSTNKTEFPIEIEDENSEELKVKLQENTPIPAPLKFNSFKFKGDIELLSGRGYVDPKDDTPTPKDPNKSNEPNRPGEIISKPELYLSPGTIIIIEETNLTSVTLEWDGTLCSNN